MSNWKLGDYVICSKIEPNQSINMHYYVEVMVWTWRLDSNTNIWLRDLDAWPTHLLFVDDIPFRVGTHLCQACCNSNQTCESDWADIAILDIRTKIGPWPLTNIATGNCSRPNLHYRSVDLNAKLRRYNGEGTRCKYAMAMMRMYYCSFDFATSILCLQNCTPSKQTCLKKIQVLKTYRPVESLTLKTEEGLKLEWQKNG